MAAEAKTKAKVLEVKELAKSFDHHAAVNGISFALVPGSVTALVGPNGSGKTTIIRTVAGLSKPDSGRIEILGAGAGSRQARSVTSIIFDEPALYADLTVWEHLAFSARLCGVEDFSGRADDLLKRFSITELRDSLPSGFSRGQRQKVSLAMGLVRPFKLLILDEPSNGLDGPGVRSLATSLTEAAEAGAAVLVATHLPDLLQVCGAMLAISEGKLVYQGKPDRSRIESPS